MKQNMVGTVIDIFSQKITYQIDSRTRVLTFWFQPVGKRLVRTARHVGT